MPLMTTNFTLPQGAINQVLAWDNTLQEWTSQAVSNSQLPNTIAYQDQINDFLSNCTFESAVRFNNTTGFFNSNPISPPTSGANLTNNSLASGTTDQIDDFTSLTVYSTDAQSIHNDIYQLARKLKQINDGLRLYGLFT